MSYMNTFYFNGRADGIGNRIEQLLYIQEYCKKNNLHCVYIWNNSNFRNYDCLISFDNITIKHTFTDNEKPYLKDNCFLRSENNIINYKFLFNISRKIDYDVIIHIRGTDRLNPYIKNYDYSTINDLNDIINNTINYINNDNTIVTYTIVTDDNKYINYMINSINKTYIELDYNYDIDKDWLDFYYLTQPNKYVVMCSQFSSYSICASILGNKQLLVFKESIKSNLPRYKANIKIIS